MKTLILRSCSDSNNTLQVQISEKAHTDLCSLFISNLNIKDLIVDDICKASLNFDTNIISKKAARMISQWLFTLIEPDDFIVVDF